MKDVKEIGVVIQGARCFKKRKFTEQNRPTAIIVGVKLDFPFFRGVKLDFSNNTRIMPVRCTHMTSVILDPNPLAFRYLASLLFWLVIGSDEIEVRN